MTSKTRSWFEFGALTWSCALLAAACSGARTSAVAEPEQSPQTVGADEQSHATGGGSPGPASAETTGARAAAGGEPAAASSAPAPGPQEGAQGRAGDPGEQNPKAVPGRCPPGMVFIEGDYCSEVQHKCTKQWYAKANDKQVCESFEPWSKCIGTKTPKRFCIDEYSWPNRVGERPEVMNNFYQAQVKCAALGKRLCTESEWTMACEGPDLKPFPYGYQRDPNKCNGDREWDRPNMNKVAKRDPAELARLWQGVPNGAQPECVSDYGVYDLPGNNDDVVSSETVSKDYRGKFDSVTTGGPWYRGVRNQCRPKIYTHNEGFYYYYLGFRCCAETDGAATDPRAPKQIQRGWDFGRVESLARFTVEQVREKLELKAKGKCECGDKDTLCKTLCGTLLGPETKDVTLGEPKPEPGKASPPASER